MMSDPTTTFGLIDKWGTRQVVSADDAREFIRDCERTIGGAFHPDNRFGDYVNNDLMPSFAFADAQILDARMDEAFGFDDPYALALEAIREFNPEDAP